MLNTCCSVVLMFKFESSIQAQNTKNINTIYNQIRLQLMPKQIIQLNGLQIKRQGIITNRSMHKSLEKHTQPLIKTLFSVRSGVCLPPSLIK